MAFLNRIGANKWTLTKSTLLPVAAANSWDDTFEIGDVLTAEPGLYDPELLKAGIRIENDYLETEDGVELLSDFTLEL